MSVKLLLVDDQTLFRRGVVTALGAFPEITVIGEAERVSDALSVMSSQLPDLVLLELNVVDDGMRALRQIKARFPEVRIVIFTGSESPSHLFRALAAGADGYVLKNVTPVELVRAVMDARAGGAPISPALCRQCMAEYRRVACARERTCPWLSPRELQVLHLVHQGKAYREVAAELSLAEGTVKNTMLRVLQKLRVRNRTEAVRYAVGSGLLGPNGAR